MVLRADHVVEAPAGDVPHVSVVGNDSQRGGGSGAGGVLGGPPNLLGYDANADLWRIIAPLPTAGYHPEFTVGGGLLFGTDQANPVIDDLGE